ISRCVQLHNQTERKDKLIPFIYFIYGALVSGSVSKRVHTGLLPISFLQASRSDVVPGGLNARHRSPRVSCVTTLPIFGFAYSELNCSRETPLSLKFANGTLIPLVSVPIRYRADFSRSAEALSERITSG